MESKSALTLPKLRFKGFKGEWERKKLGNISLIKTGSKDLKDKDDNGRFPFFVRSDKIEKINSYSFDGEAILIPGDGKIGEIYHYINGKFDYHQRVYKISNTKENLKFIYFLFQKNIKKYLLSFSAKATVDSIRLPMLLNFKISLPSLPEQQKIAHFFSLLDKQIKLWERKLELYELKKKYYLNNLFYLSNKIPKLRFKEHKDEWKKVLLKEIILDCENTYTKTNLFLDATSILQKTYLVYCNQEFKNSPSDSIVYIKDGSNSGEFFYSGLECKISSTCDYIKTNNNNSFIYYFLNLKKTYIKNSLTIGETIPHLYKKTLVNLPLFLPSIKEQNKISSFFIFLDEQIKKFKCKKNLIISLKKYYLNKLFI